MGSFEIEQETKASLPNSVASMHTLLSNSVVQDIEEWITQLKDIPASIKNVSLLLWNSSDRTSKCYHCVQLFISTLDVLYP